MKHNKGTASWSIWHNENKIISSQLVVDGTYIDSFRAEMSGICGALSFLSLMHQNKHFPSFEHYCDSESAIKMIKKYKRHTIIIRQQT